MFPTKFRPLIEKERSQVSVPAEVTLIYVVCGCETRSCGWEGWMLDGEGSSQACPNCARRMFRTDVSVIYGNPKDDDGVPNFDYEVAPPEYAEDPDRELAQEWTGVALSPCDWIDAHDHEHCQICGWGIDTCSAAHSRAYTDGEHHWACPMCYDRISRARAKLT